MKNIFEQLVELLKKDARLVSQDGILLKNQTQELARKNDPALIKLLLSDKAIKQHLFFEVEDTLIFDKEKFIRFISNKQFLPDSYTAFKNKIGLTAGDEYLNQNKEVVLAWAYKDCVLEGGMTKEEQKRDEIFYNETLAPDDINRLLDTKVFTNFKRIDKKGEHKLDGFNRDEKGIIKENLLIKGNNLLALSSLKKEFAGKVKLIYIDPPYNTGNDGFKYNDSFNHSTWLTFMRNRLEVARQLLSEEGLIFVQIDDIEYAYLKILMDEIFTRECYVVTITVKSKTPSGVGQESIIFDITERIMVYSKNKEKTKTNNIKIFDEIVGENSRTVDNYNLVLEDHGQETFLKELTTGKGNPIKVYTLKNFTYTKTPKVKCTKQWAYENYHRIFRVSPANGGLMKKITPLLPSEPCCIEYIPKKGKNANKTTKIYFLNNNMLVMLSETSIINHTTKQIEKMVNVHNNWTEESLWQGIANEGGVKLKNGKKPEALIKRIFEIASSEGDIVLDFFGGSGTTGAVAHKMGRQYILIEQMDYIHNLPEARLIKVMEGEQGGISKDVNWQGGGDFIYCELAQWNEQAKKEIQDAKDLPALIKLFDTLYEKYFLNYNLRIKEFREEIIEDKEGNFRKLSLEQQKKMFLTMLNLNQMYVHEREMADKRYGISKEDQNLTRRFYGKE